ncbi:MAG: hypothetical protein ABIH87_01560 [bacterium]
MKQVATPPQIPASKIRKPIIPIIVSVLIALIAGGSIVYFYQDNYIKNLERQNRHLGYDVESGDKQIVKLEDEKKELKLKSAATPLFYTKYVEDPLWRGELRTVDPITLEESILYTEKNYHLGILAIPTINFDGRIFISRHAADAGDPSLVPLVMDFKDYLGKKYPQPGDVPEPKPVSFADQLPFVGSSMAISPDQTRIAAAYDNPINDPDTVEQKTIVTWDLLTGEKNEVGRVASDEYLAENVGSSMGGSSGYDIHWFDLDCINVSVFTDYPADAAVADPYDKKYKETRKFCIERKEPLSDLPIEFQLPSGWELYEFNASSTKFFGTEAERIWWIGLSSHTEYIKEKKTLELPYYGCYVELINSEWSDTVEAGAYKYGGLDWAPPPGGDIVENYDLPGAFAVDEALPNAGGQLSIYKKINGGLFNLMYPTSLESTLDGKLEVVGQLCERVAKTLQSTK